MTMTLAPVVTLRALLCVACGQKLAETDGTSIVVRRRCDSDHRAITMTFSCTTAVIECPRVVMTDGRARVCRAVNEVCLLTGTPPMD